MNGYEKLCIETSLRLGRTLAPIEKDFLSWLYNRHLEEQRTKELQMAVKKNS